MPPSHSHEGTTTGQRSSRGTHSVVVTAERRGISTVGPAGTLTPAACTQMSTSGLGENPEHRQKVFTPFLNETPQLVSRHTVFCLFVCCYSFSKFMESTAKRASWSFELSCYSWAKDLTTLGEDDLTSHYLDVTPTTYPSAWQKASSLSPLTALTYNMKASQQLSLCLRKLIQSGCYTRTN